MRYVIRSLEDETKTNIFFSYVQHVDEVEGENFLLPPPPLPRLSSKSVLLEPLYLLPFLFPWARLHLLPLFHYLNSSCLTFLIRH